MKKITHLFFVLCLSVFVLGVSSCKKDKDSPELALDVRDQGTGVYDYSSKYYANVDTGFVRIQGDGIGTIVVRKHADKPIIEFVTGGQVFLYTDTVVETSNGFAFNVPSQMYYSNSGSYTIEGKEGGSFTVGDRTYNGIYDNATQILKVTYIGYYHPANITLTEFEGKKLKL